MSFGQRRLMVRVGPVFHDGHDGENGNDARHDPDEQFVEAVAAFSQKLRGDRHQGQNAHDDSGYKDGPELQSQ